MINLSNSLPAAPAGGTNVSWQSDVSGNVSAYIPSSGSASWVTFAPVAGILTIDASQGNHFIINVNSAITASSIINPTDSQDMVILWSQDSTGHAITLPVNLLGATAPSTGANLHSCQRFSYLAASTNWYSNSAASLGM